MNDLLLLSSLIINLIVLGLLVILFRISQAKNKTSQEEINEGSDLKKNSARSLEETLSKNIQIVENTSKGIMKYYQDTVTALELNYNQNTEKLMNLLNEELKKKTAEMDKKILEELENAEKEVSNQVRADLLETKKEIEDYKKEKLKEIDKVIFQIIEQTAKEALSKTLNLTDQENLVIESLEKAKKERFFSGS